MKNRLNLPSESDINEILKFDQKKLPSFPQVAAKLLEASKDETASLQDLSRIIETDPGISVKVLEIVNSAMYGLGRKITALSEAVVFIGLDEIKKLALGMTIFENLFKTGSNKQFDKLLFWRHSLSVAVLSMEIAKELHYSNPEEAYIAGLLHDVGKIFLDIQGRKSYGDFIQELCVSTDLIIEKERSHLGLGHDDVGAYFCAQWKLPEKLILAVKYHHQPFECKNFNKEEAGLISIVSLANFLCWTQGIGSFDFIRPPILSPEVEKITKPEKIDIIKCILAMNKEIENISEFYHFVFPSPNQLKENLLWANIKLSNANTRYYYKEDPLTQFQNAKIERDEYISPDLTFDYGKPLAKAKNVKEVLDIVMYQVGRIFQPLNWSILLKDSKTGDMIFSVVVGKNKDKLQGAKLPKGEGIAGHIMASGESLIIEDVSKDDRFSTRVDKHTGFETKSIIGTPLKTDDKTFGVIELINRISDDPFTNNDLELLSSIAEYAAIAIERSYYNQALTNIATKDSVTNLKNRWSFEREVSNKEGFQKKYGTVFSVLITRIKGLDHINGDKAQTEYESAVKEIGRILSATKRRGDTLFRYAEDIFIMLLPLTYSDGSEKVKQRIEEVHSKSTAAKKLDTSIGLDILSYTLSAGDSGQLKTIVRDLLIKSKTASSPVKDTVGDLDENLQTLLEQENKKALEELEKTEAFGKDVSFGGSFIRLKTGESGHIRVERVSLVAIGFRISKSHRIKTNDFLDIQFVLDDIKKSLIKRRVVVREIKGNYFKADFYNPPPFAKNLGFYLMS